MVLDLHMSSGELSITYSMGCIQRSLTLYAFHTLLYTFYYLQFRLDDGFFRMYYNGVDSNGETAIGVAKSVDLMNWTREQAALTFSL